MTAEYQNVLPLWRKRENYGGFIDCTNLEMDQSTQFVEWDECTTSVQLECKTEIEEVEGNTDKRNAQKTDRKHIVRLQIVILLRSSTMPKCRPE